MTEGTTTEPTPGVDRRSALKKAAAAAGIAAWATPTVQALTPGIAAAATVTACQPILTVVLRKTGPTCRCVAAAPNQCCSDISYALEVSATCGSTCLGTATPSVASTLGGKPGCPTPGLYPQLEQCQGTIAVPLTGTVLCPDGISYPIDGTYAATCIDCVTANATAAETFAPPEDMMVDPSSAGTDSAPAATDPAPVITDPATVTTEPSTVITDPATVTTDAASTTDSP